MTSIEERIVSLGFNNKSFEQHAAQSMSTLDKLDGMLNAFGGSKGMSLLTDTLETVSSKFSVMGTIGDQVLRRIADGAMDAANKLIQMGKSMSIDQVSAGWGKYQEKTASVQTIMNSTGDSIDKVNGYLSELMWYSDETSFGFTDMTSALGQMTSTGGKVENLIPLLMGVGNAVAYAGKGASEFSRVVYNLNQSYGAGALQLMDWKSLELAGVASKELKQAFIDVAIAQGKIKEGEVTVANFNQTLSKKWADTEVMEGAFGKFAEMTMEAKRLIDAGVYRNATEAYQALASKYGEVAVKAAQSAQEAKSFTEAIEATQDAVSSGWLTTFEHIFGNYEEAKKLWTNLTDVLWEMFAASAEMRNEVLERWHNAKVGGYQTLMEALENVFEVITKVTNLTRGGLLKVILGSKGDDAHALTLILIKATKAFKFFSEDLLKFTNNIERFQVIEKIFTGLHAIFVALKTPLVWLKQAFIETFKPLFTYNGNQLKWPRDLAIIISQLATKFMELGISLNKWIKSSSVVQSLSNLAWGIASVFEFIFTGIRSFIDQLKYNFEPEVRKFRIDTILDSLSKFGGLLMTITSSLKDSGALNTFVTILLEIFGLFGDIFDIVSITVNSLLGTLLNKSAGAGNAINNILQVILKVIQSIRGVLNNLIESGWIEYSVSGIGAALQGVFHILSKIVSFLTSGNPFETIGNALKTVFEWGKKAFGVIKDGFRKIDVGSVLKTGGGIGVLAVIAKKLYDLFTGKGLFGSFKKFLEEAGKGITGVLEGIGDAVGSFATSQKAKAIKDVAISLALMAGALLVLSLIKPEKLAKALGAVAAGLLLMIGALYLLNKLDLKKGVANDLLKAAGAMLLFGLAVGAVAVAMLIMAGAIKVLSTIDPEALFMSVLAVVVVLSAITLALTVLSKYASGKKMLAAGASILMLSVGILILTAALAALSFIPFDKLQNGITALAFVLIIVGGALALLSLAGAKVLLAAGAILIVSAAILALTAALVVLSMIPGEALAKGLLMIAGTLVTMVAALLILSLAGPMALVAAGALAILGVGIVLAAAGLVIMAVALRAMKPVKRDLPKIAGGLALIGAAMLALGIGGIAAGLGLVGFLAMVPLAFALSLMRGLDIAKIAGGLALLGLAFIPLGIGALALGLGSIGLITGAVGLALLGVALPSLARGMEAMKSISLATMTGLALGLGAIGLAGVFLMAGATGLLIGTPALIAFSEALPPLADGLNAFASVLWEALGKGAVALAEAILAMFAVNVIALLGDGMSIIGSFASQLPSLADGIMAFDGVTGESLANAGVALSDAIKAMFATNLIALLGDGMPVIGSFASQLPTLASGFQAFDTLNPDTIISVGQALATSIKSIAGAGLASIIDGTPALVRLGEALPTLATGFRAFEGLDPEWIRATAVALADAIKALTGDFFSNLFSTTPDYSSLASGITQIAAAVASIPADGGDRIMAIGEGLVSLNVTAADILGSITMTLVTIYTNVVLYSTITIQTVQMECNSVLEILRGFDASMRNIFNAMLNNLSSVASSTYSSGVSIGQNLANGLWSQVSEVEEAARALQAAASAAESAMRVYSSIGSTTSRKRLGANGFGYVGSGINYAAMYSKAGQSAGSSFGNGVSSGAKSSLGIKSPSKVFAEIGKYTAMGFANGLSDGSTDVNSGVDSMMSPMLAAITSMMSEDLSPTIKPVMDMTNVDAAADEFGNMFAATGSYAMNAAGRISANDRASRQGTVESNFTSDNAGVQNGITVNVYPSAGMDERALADKVVNRINEISQRIRVAKG
jgi:hypothetical protein